MDEINYALDANKSTIAVHLESIELSPGMRLRLNSHQAILKFELNEKEYKEKLLASALQQESSSGTASRIKGNSIAVLPFVNMSSDADQEYFSDGISEDILNGLVNFPDLKVIARSSSFQFKGDNQDIRQIGRKLNVNHVLEGSVRKAGNRVRITTQLIQVSDGSHVWSERYDRELTDVFEVQDEVTEKILTSLNVHLASELPTRRETNIDAYQAFLMGKFQHHRSNLGDAIQYFKDAIFLDEAYEDAYVGLIEAHLDYVLVGVNPEANKQLVGQYSMSLRAFSPEQPVLQMAIAMQQFYVLREYQSAIDTFARLINELPDDDGIIFQFVFICNAIGRIDLSLACQRHRVQIDPLNPKAHANVGHSYTRSGQYGQALISLDRAETMGNPVAFFSAMLAVGVGDFDALQKQVNRDVSDWTYLHKWHPTITGLCAYLKKDDEKLNEILAGINKDDYPFYERSFIANLEGETELAIDLYAGALEASEIMAFSEVQAQVDGGLLRKMFPDFCDHPRFQQMLVEYKLDEDSISRLTIPSLPF